MEKIVSLAKRRGFLFPGSDIYGGLAGTYDYGPLGVLLKRNLTDLWWRMMVERRSDMFGLDSSILSSAKVWQASGHVSHFSDPLVDCKKCKSRFRADELADGACSQCGGKEFTDAKRFNMMFSTHAGPVEDTANTVYLRPETAQGMFINFKNVVDAFHPQLPFGIAQIGKAFRNEITPGNFLFRLREFEQMEIEYFIRPEEWERYFEQWRANIHHWADALGLSSLDEREIPEGDRAHYSKRTIDFYFNFPFGEKELYGLAYRTDYDLANHARESGTELSLFEESEGRTIVPHVIEPTFGVDRTILAVLCDAYREEEDGDSVRTVLGIKPALAPYKAAVFPLLSNKPDLVSRAELIFSRLQAHFSVRWDDIGNIGKRYRRQDEIGTPFCITVDFETLEDGTVTVRDRDTMQQQRVPEGDLVSFLTERTTLQHV